MIQVSHFSTDGMAVDGSTSDLADFLSAPGTTWIDLHAPSDDEFEAVNKLFRWHPLAIDDLRVETHLPKVDDFGDYLLIVAHAVAIDEEGRFDTAEIEIFVGPNYLVTHHVEPVETIDQLLSRCHRNHALASKGPAYLLYLLLDGMADVYLPYLESLDDRIDDIEEEILAKPDQSTQARIYALKRDVIRLRRIVLPQAEVFRRLARGEFPILPPESAMYFRDVHDHLFRVSEEANSYRDLLTAALDSYLSAVSNEMNKVMKVLTVFASIFIPLTFLAGVWGMNFSHMPELSKPWGYPVALASMVTAAILLLWFFRRKRWL
jgi:magnesium transporter